ncbi:MAG TPA: hypothetical protein PK093_18245 [Phycisphaerae bacterium]|mgnify:CR=1 FL=1|nr:hypothetical protein [Phycisphaerae bacterium]
MLADEAWRHMFEMPQIAIVLGCVFGCMIPIAGIIGTFWLKAQKMRSDNELKSAMVHRGMSAAEIERILAADAGPPREFRQ